MEMSPIAGDVVAWQHIEIQIRENGDRWCMRMARAVAKRGSGCRTKWVGVSYMGGLALVKYALAATRQRQLIWFTFHFRLPCKLQQHLRTYTPIHLYTFTMHMCRCHTHTHPHTHWHTRVLEAERYAIITFVISNLKCKLLQWSVVNVVVVVFVAFLGTAPWSAVSTSFSTDSLLGIRDSGLGIRGSQRCPSWWCTARKHWTF